MSVATLSAMPPLTQSAAEVHPSGDWRHAQDTTVKHGALSSEEGRIEITWKVEIGPADPLFTLTWMESAGPPVVAPAHKGFGTTVITKMAAMNLDGETHLDYASSGLIWRLECPVKNIREGK